jgi:hypothetical protein
VAVIYRLTHGESGRWVNLDVLENALKTDGFSRPPGSPRLVTRLRTLKDFEIDSHGRVRITPGSAPPPAAEAPAESAAPATPAKRRRKRRSKAASTAAAAGEAAQQ